MEGLIFTALLWIAFGIWYCASILLQIEKLLRE